MRRYRLYVVVFSVVMIFINCGLSLCAASLNCVRDSDPEVSLEEKVDQFIASLPVTFHGSILIEAGDKILVHKGYGLANRSYDIPNEPDTKYLIGSITKLFTAVLVLQMAEKGLLNLDATIDTYLPYFPKKNASRITVRHLLEHKSGIPHHFIGIPGYFEVHDKYFHTPLEYMKHFWDIELVHKPGERLTYTSPGYYVLGVILETVSKKSYAELLEENIFGPLGMRNTHVHNNRKIHKNMATGYKKGLEGYALAGMEEESTRLAAGNILSTVKDLYIFQKILDFKGDNILSEKNKKMLLEPHSRNFSLAGLVMSVPYNEGKDKMTFIRAGGSSYGFRALMDRIIEKDACMIALSNIQTDRVSLYDIFEELGDFLVEEMGIDMGPRHRAEGKDLGIAVPLDQKESCSFEGFYELKSGAIIGIFHENNKLFRRVLSEQTGYLGDAVMPRELRHRGQGVFDVNGIRGLQYRFIKTPVGIGYKIALYRRDRLQDEAEKIKFPVEFDISEYEGRYFSVELQKTYRFSAKDGRLFTDEFLGDKDVSFLPLKKDVFGYDNGFLIFHRYDDGKIRDFKLENENVDRLLGSMFIRK
ncbi:MAG: serine hydrolase [Candidatus Aminicenantes bacterium]|nr:serine hydrolase [Candidatus Aminicenantes bacterium]